MYYGPEHFLEQDNSGGGLMAHARLLLKLSRRFEAIAPAPFRHAARVANYRSGKIVIHAENGAVAAKIRQMSQRLCDELSKGGTECNALEVKVQPRQSPFQSSTSTYKPLSGKTFDVLRSTQENLPKGALRDALAHLIERAGRQD